ncbi:PREDICTED: uncharacterized protein LOC109479320 [Branchiostoma belcheri]|uniref:Uncharacterized protein LOC109479320 n=1 Tax=Branchiostoma belcheri TaxID=7741 RepID=A0A6P4ZRX3_BRABE|nr:PREDICTED: uncharacterized protein LOC109479320 [Branchiostoma belcheri]
MMDKQTNKQTAEADLHYRQTPDGELDTPDADSAGDVSRASPLYCGGDSFFIRDWKPHAQGRRLIKNFIAGHFRQVKPLSYDRVKGERFGVNSKRRAVRVREDRRTQEECHTGSLSHAHVLDQRNLHELMEEKEEEEKEEEKGTGPDVMMRVREDRGCGLRQNQASQLQENTVI